MPCAKPTLGFKEIAQAGAADTVVTKLADRKADNDGVDEAAVSEGSTPGNFESLTEKRSGIFFYRKTSKSKMRAQGLLEP